MSAQGYLLAVFSRFSNLMHFTSQVKKTRSNAAPPKKKIPLKVSAPSDTHTVHARSKSAWLEPANILASAMTLVTFACCIATFETLRANRDAVQTMNRQIEASTRPYVFLDFVQADGAVEAVLRNTGVTAALNVKMTITPMLRYQLLGGSGPAQLPQSVIPLLPPGREIRELVYRRAGNEGEPSVIPTYNVQIDYSNVDGQKFCDRYQAHVAATALVEKR